MKVLEFNGDGVKAETTTLIRTRMYQSPTVRGQRDLAHRGGAASVVEERKDKMSW